MRKNADKIAHAARFVRHIASMGQMLKIYSDDKGRHAAKRLFKLKYSDLRKAKHGAAL